MGRSVSRREFLRDVALYGAAIAGGYLVASEGEGKLATRVLGRTKLKVTVVSFGGLRLENPDVLSMAIDKGMNLIHTSPGYAGGRSIKAFGEVMKTKRSKVYLALKDSPTGNIDGALKILNTDYVDILLPQIDIPDQVRNERWIEGYERLKKEGKIRFTGFACHTNIPAVMEAAIEFGYHDVMLISYNIGNRKMLDPLIERAAEKGIGIMAMKAMGGLRRGDPETIVAGLKSLLTNKGVHTLLIGMTTFEEVECNLKVGAGELTKAEAELLERHMAVVAATLCAGCGKCNVCPKGISIADLMRCYEYAMRGDLDVAKEAYTSLRASCVSCDGCKKCELACPKGLPIARRLNQLHTLLS
ncbi:MAG: aldo/keto reductase [Armatimonadota bacterium]|nr:aldo/keto reductase [Armatimonadota bacterium]MCX7777341.1 aldo/keto reductase [Armatimonadota bacterium]MDW8025391.1 aldo/keto reductase [Armatimonadota bacterium]